MFEWWCVLPFAALLSCIAIFPLTRVQKLWHHNWFQLLVAMTFGLPVGIWMLAIGKTSAVVHSLVEYAQFVTVLLALYVISFGICVAGDIRATPKNNVKMFAAGAAMASIIGTTGAAMLMLRPILNTNSQRRNKQHLVVFFIFIVANCGGLLTPLGDPPLLLGYFRGVPFTWTLSMLPEWTMVNGTLLLSFYALDRKMYALESEESIRADDEEIEPIKVFGLQHVMFLGTVVASVALLPSVDLKAIHNGNAVWISYVPVREIAMVLAMMLSMLTDKLNKVKGKSVRFELNGFKWAPILEVACLFIGIFLAMIPALDYVRQMAPNWPLDQVSLFIITGGLSSVLDNAPTYLTFFEIAKELPGDPRVAGVPAVYLRSISLGAVLLGANTYIGNGPNFMVKAIAEAFGVEMPSFAGYTLKWSLRYLVPTLVAMMLIRIVPNTGAIATGWLLLSAITTGNIWQAYRYRDPHAHRHLMAVKKPADEDQAA